jgi:hypothetical protein
MTRSICTLEDGRENSAVDIKPEDIPGLEEKAATQRGALPASVSTLDGLTLTDIPRLVQAAQATEKRPSAPPQNLAPYVAELTPLELTIVRYAAVAVLYHSSLRDEMDLDQVLETRFWEKLFKVGKKKKGALTYRFALVRFLGLMMSCTGGRPLRGGFGASRRSRWRGLGLVTRCIRSHT